MFISSNNIAFQSANHPRPSNSELRDLHPAMSHDNSLFLENFSNLSIGERIRLRRKQLSLSPNDIKELSGISTGNLSDIENNKSLPSASTLISLNKVLNVSVDWILFGTISEPLHFNEETLFLINAFNELSTLNKGRLLGTADTLLNLQASKKEKSSPSLPSHDEEAATLEKLLHA